jgi:hypothetical protein
MNSIRWDERRASVPWKREALSKRSKLWNRGGLKKAEVQASVKG